MSGFSDCQYGFWSSRSTTDILTVVFDRRVTTFNMSGATECIKDFLRGLACWSCLQAEVFCHIWSLLGFRKAPFMILIFSWYSEQTDYIFFVLFWIHSMQGWTATTKHGVTRKRSTERLEHTRNLVRKNLQLIGVC